MVRIVYATTRKHDAGEFSVLHPDTQNRTLLYGIIEIPEESRAAAATHRCAAHLWMHATQQEYHTSWSCRAFESAKPKGYRAYIFAARLRGL